MVKNKRKHPGLDELLDRPWCYYCERDFDDLKILISHQKAKHYKCERCGRRLNTAGGLSVHMTQVHKETLTSIENALPNRAGLEVEIFGMEGIPDDVSQSHRQRMLQNFAQAQADRRASTGNPAPGGEGAAKKPKVEEPTSLKERLAAHKARKAAEAEKAASGGESTPAGAGESVPSPNNYGAVAAPIYTAQQQPYGGAPNGSFPGQTPPYGQQSPFPQQSSPPPFAPPQQVFSPPGMPQPYPNNQPFAPPQQFGPGPPVQAAPPFPGGPPQFPNGPPPQFQSGPPHFQQGPPQFQGGAPPHFQNGAPMQFGPPQHFGPGSPGPFPQQQFQPPRNNTPPSNIAVPQRPPSLPPAPGLPQRPVVNAPQVNYQQMQQMHQGQFSGAPPNVPQGAVASPGSSPANLPPNASSIDELVSGAARDAEKAAEVKAGAPTTPATDGKKKDKKDTKGMKLIYSDNETSPEEKLARLPRYAFSPAVMA